MKSLLQMKLTELVKVIQVYENSHFNKDMAALFLQDRIREMKTVDIIIGKKIDGIVIDKASTGDGNICLFRHPCTIMLELNVFRPGDIAEEYVNTTVGDHSERDRWFWSDLDVSIAGSKYRELVAFHEQNKENRICYLIV